MHSVVEHNLASDSIVGDELVFVPVESGRPPMREPDLILLAVLMQAR